MRKRAKVVTKPPRCPHHSPQPSGLYAILYDAEDRIKRGEKQVQCPVCKLYFWPDEMGVKETQP